MGFIKTPDELARIADAFATPEFVSGERLTVEFLTDPATVERLLPPPLQPTDTPLALASVGRWQSDFVGDYAGGSIYLAARHEDVVGAYALAMWMDTEISVAYGRDVFGEPKKLATTGLFRRGDSFHGYVERHGVRLLELHADLGPDEGPGHADGHAFNYRARPTVDGSSLDGPATLTHAHFDTEIIARRIGTGTVTLRATPHDPVDEVEVGEVVRAVYMEHDISATVSAVATVPPDVFLPYYFGRSTDDFLAFAKAGATA